MSALGIHQITRVRLYFLPVRTRVPLKFGHETLHSVTCARVAIRAADADGNEAEGWGETPLSVQWVWPSTLSYETRHGRLKQFCQQLAEAWSKFDHEGHALEIGHAFLETTLPSRLEAFNRAQSQGESAEAMPWLAALVCNSAFDLALHDACGKLLQLPIYETYRPPFLASDLSAFLEPAPGSGVSFRGKYPADCLRPAPLKHLPAWHLVGGLDLLETSQLNGSEPDDGYPVVLRDWIRRDGLRCLKIKLRGNDLDWDVARLVHVGRLSAQEGVEWLSADFNCTVHDPAYVHEVLNVVERDQPDVYRRLLYVEQPFPYELERHRIDVRTLSARKPLFLDESAHDWRVIRLGRELGWNGVALKTCKTQTGAILSACWAKAHGLALMVQDLTNPMLAQLSHVQLAAHTETIMGVETNSMQFYPAASDCEAKVHPGIYRRVEGSLDLSTLAGPGFGYRLEEINRELPVTDY